MDLTGRKMILYLRNSLGTAAEAGFVPAWHALFRPERSKGISL